MPLILQIYFSFPVRLLVLHLRSHLILLVVWTILAAFSAGLAGRFFGMHYLMLTPEYQGQVNFLSFLISGIAFGGLVMIWHLTTYLLCSNRFPFLATLGAPFTKYCLNNSLVPLGFLLVWFVCTTWFQWHDELTSSGEIIGNIAGFMLGTVVTSGIFAAYFHLTNKDLDSFHWTPRLGGRVLFRQRLPSVQDIQIGATRWRVDTYLTERCHPRLVRSVSHYDPKVLEQVFRQNHWNAVVVLIAGLFFLMAQGIFMEKEWARIPAGATLYMLAGIVMALYGAIRFWFRQWGTAVFLGLIFTVNLLTGWGLFNYRNRAYGLDYTRENRAGYTYKAFEKIAAPAHIQADKAATQQILENWLIKNRTAENPKPKLVLICASGGGHRAALWTIQTLQKADIATGGKLLRQATLMTGASGGLLGAAHVREAMLRHAQGDRLAPQDPVLLEDMGKDLLNAVSFAVVANDLFFPMSSFTSGNFSYRKDRGYLFEHQLNENTHGFFSRKLAEYREPEKQAQIPMLVASPFILNDARRMLISPQGVSYLMQPNAGKLAAQMEIDGIDFGRFFADQQADSLAFSSAMRMSCTYPFILPNVWLPTQPSVEALDAGFRDNYGIGLAVRFVHVFKDWIQQNTGGVVLVQIRCWDKIHSIAPSDDKGVFEALMTPAEAAGGNMTDIQDFEQDNALALLNDAMGGNMLEVVRFHYRPVRKNREASLSFHLSRREKLDIFEAFYTGDNQASVKALKQVLR
ncbi:MAG: patatin-like phospholipase family protein [Saprospiraceae bacterium]|nr:patatin-like phospholipase family protein [Saprospiraceae bacterium]